MAAWHSDRLAAVIITTLGMSYAASLIGSAAEGMEKPPLIRCGGVPPAIVQIKNSVKLAIQAFMAAPDPFGVNRWISVSGIEPGPPHSPSQSEVTFFFSEIEAYYISAPAYPWPLSERLVRPHR